MQRREFIAGLGGAAAWPVAARAQQRMPVIGFLGTGSPDPFAYLVRAFRQGLSETGFVEGRNVAIEYSWANDQIDRMPALAANLVRRQVNLIVANSTAAALAGPGGNLTGVTSLAGELSAKRLELLHEFVPAVTNIAVLLNPNDGSPSIDLQPAARTLGVQLHMLHASAERDFDTLFATLARLRVGALLISP
jgi:putative tryptophan/tyrosine transport system substrate-binding protein